MTAPKLSEQMAADEISAVVFQDVLPIVISLERRLESAERVVDRTTNITGYGNSGGIAEAIQAAQEHRRNFPKEPDHG